MVHAVVCTSMTGPVCHGRALQPDGCLQLTGCVVARFEGSRSAGVQVTSSVKRKDYMHDSLHNSHSAVTA
jgi:hypothetical protein